MTTTGAKTKKKDIDAKKELASSLDESIEHADRFQKKLSDKLERANKALDIIREAGIKEGVKIEGLDEAIAQTNELRLINAKMVKYLDVMKNPDAPPEKKVAIVGVMVELESGMDNIIEE